MTLSLGKPGTVQQPLRPEVDDFEIAQFGPYELVPLPVVYTGLQWGQNGVSNYPNYLEDGMILSRMSSTRYSAPELAALGITNVDEYYDFAPDASAGPLYLVFTNQVGFRVSGMENIVHDYNKATDPWTPLFAGSPLKPTFASGYDPGATGSFNVTGVIGLGEAWIGGRLTQEGTLVGYTANDYLTVEKGKFRKAVTGEKVIGQVEFKFTKNSRTKMRIRFDFSLPFTM